MNKETSNKNSENKHRNLKITKGREQIINYDKGYEFHFILARMTIISYIILKNRIRWNNFHLI
jgi:hypothetical protein